MNRRSLLKGVLLSAVLRPFRNLAPAEVAGEPFGLAIDTGSEHNWGFEDGPVTWVCPEDGVYFIEMVGQHCARGADTYSDHEGA